MIDPHPFSLRAAAGQAHLRLMETTDLHVHVHPHDYFADRPVDGFGLARTASLARRMRAGAANALLFDDGDFLQGNPMGDYVAQARGLGPGRPHPVIAAMNAVGVDAATIGNHDFNYGVDFLARALADAAFPLVCANLATRAGAGPRADRTLLPPYVILERTLIDGAGAAHPIRVGVIGALPPQVMTWDRHHLEGRVVARDIVASVAAWIPEMRERGCDLVVVLAHSGIAGARHMEGMENAAVPLAALPGVDAVMTGHLHRVFPGPDFARTPEVDPVAGTIHGKPATMAGFRGSHLGVIDLLLERDGAGWRVVAAESAAHPIVSRGPGGAEIPTVEDDPEVVASVAEAHAGTLAHVRRPVGSTEAPMHTYFALVRGDAALRLICRAQAAHVAARLAGTPYAEAPILSAAAPFRSGGAGGPHNYTDVPAGPLVLRNVADLYLYPNRISALHVTGAQLRDWLERSAGAFNRIAPGAVDAPLLDPAFPSYNFDVIAGVTYRIDLSQPARFCAAGELIDPEAARIVDLAHDGRPVRDDMTFVVATNDYRAGGGGAFPGLDGSAVILDGPDTNREVVLRHVVAEGCIHVPETSGWSFVPMPGATAIFETGPGAADHPDDAARLGLEPAGQGEGGFDRYRLRL